MVDSKLFKSVKRNCLLNQFLADELNISKTKAKKLIDQRNIFINDRRVWIASYQLKPGDRVEVILLQKRLRDEHIEVIYQDNEYLIVNKRPGILTNDKNSLEEMLRKQLNNNKIIAVHRLDKDTSGLVIFAKDKIFLEKIIELFRQQQVRKIYRAIAIGPVSPDRLVLDTPLQGQEAVTRVKVLARNKTASYLELEITTGRTHQIRLHLQQIKHPLAGEKIYDNRKQADSILREIPRQMLHAYQLEFPNPYSQKRILAKVKEPEDFKKTLDKLKISS